MIRCFARFTEHIYPRASYLALSASALAFSCGISLAGPEVPAEFTPVIERAEWLGTALYVHDSAAARATDELMRRGVLEKDTRIRGWITAMTDNSNAVLVTFVGEQDGTPHALHRVTVRAGTRSLRYQALTPALPLTTDESASYAARTLALDELNKESERCSETYNTVVLPIQRQGDHFILVYLLAATNQSGVVVAGGHIRYEVSPDGKRIEGQRTFTRSCLVIPQENAEKGKTPVAMMLTHLLDPTPTEIHVFMSRLYEKPFYIGTAENDLVWLVDGSSIRLLDASKTSSAK
jgi:hypothetical protein